MSERATMTVKVPAGLLEKIKASAVLFDQTLESVAEEALVEWSNKRLPKALLTKQRDA